MPTRTRYDGRGYSISIHAGHRELVSVTYVRGTDSFTLDGERYGTGWDSISVWLDEKIDDGLVTQLVKDLSEGLTAMGYGFTISRFGARQAIPEDERQQAIASLRAMGMEAIVSGDEVKLTKLPTFSTAGMSRAEVITHGEKIMELAGIASGHRRSMTVLAKKDPEAS